MHLPQLKVVDFKNLINVAICLTTKEFPLYEGSQNFKATGESITLNNEPKSVHAWVTIDQLQAEKIVQRLGFGKYGTESNKKNVIHYTMKLNEKGEGSTVNGDITYIIQSVEINGVKYAIKKGSTLPSGAPISTEFKETYHNKSSKNSTLFKFLRKLVYNDYFQFEKVGAHLEAMDKAAPALAIPKEPKTPKNKADKSAKAN